MSYLEAPIRSKRSIIIEDPRRSLPIKVVVTDDP
jgi:hypothetical protein